MKLEAKPWRFCASCGGTLEAVTDDGEMKCGRCGRSWYRSSSPTVGCVIVRDGRALVTVRGVEPYKGQLDVPGGFLEAGEDPIEGLKREVDEELGVSIDVSVEDCLSMAAHRYGDGGDFVLALGFGARLVEGEPTPQDDVADVEWISLAELDEVDFAWAHDRELVRKTLERARKSHQEEGT